jgi:hypothetical protein
MNELVKDFLGFYVRQFGLVKYETRYLVKEMETHIHIDCYGINEKINGNTLLSLFPGCQSKYKIDGKKVFGHRTVWDGNRSVRFDIFGRKFDEHNIPTQKNVIKEIGDLVKWKRDFDNEDILKEYWVPNKKSKETTNRKGSMDLFNDG